MFTISTIAREAGVGVVNVPPQFGYIRITQSDGLMKVYLKVSNFNSWQDIYTVNVILENNDVETAKFIFKQYENKDSFNEIKEFREISDENLLYLDECASSHADNTD